MGLRVDDDYFQEETLLMGSSITQDKILEIIDYPELIDIYNSSLNLIFSREEVVRLGDEQDILLPLEVLDSIPLLTLIRDDITKDKLKEIEDTLQLVNSFNDELNHIIEIEESLELFDSDLYDKLKNVVDAIVVAELLSQDEIKNLSDLLTLSMSHYFAGEEEYHIFDSLSLFSDIGQDKISEVTDTLELAGLLTQDAIADFNDTLLLHNGFYVYGGDLTLELCSALQLSETRQYDAVVDILSELELTDELKVLPEISKFYREKVLVTDQLIPDFIFFVQSVLRLSEFIDIPTKAFFDTITLADQKYTILDLLAESVLQMFDDLAEGDSDLDLNEQVRVSESIDISLYKGLIKIIEERLTLSDIKVMSLGHLEELHLVENLFIDDIHKHNVYFADAYENLGYKGYLVTEPLTFGTPALKLLRSVELIGQFNYEDIEVTIDYRTLSNGTWTRRPWKTLLPTNNYEDSISGIEFRVAIRSKSYAKIDNIKPAFSIIDNRFRRSKEFE